MLISEIVEFTKSKDKVVFEDGEFIVVYKGMVDKKAEELSEEEYNRLFKDMLVYGKRRAMNLLVRRDRSVKELTDKLSEDGYNEALTGAILDYLDSYHYLDDLRVAKQLVRANRDNKSIREVREVLKKHGISEEVSEEAVSTAYRAASEETEDCAFDDSSASAEHETEVIVSILKKKHLTPEIISALEYDERQKLAAKLFRKGFKSENIRKALTLSEFD